MLTLPASFDEVARELTIKAAALAGLPRVVLIEEPQAAFYAWIDHNRDRWDQLVKPGQKILICDIGGGTSDFTLIRVRRGEGGKVQFHRVAVGDHLILGGDNLDLALAHHLEERLARGRGSREQGRAAGRDDKQRLQSPRRSRPVTASPRLQPRQWAMLVQRSRQLKETLLGPNPPEKVTLNLPWSGSRLIGGAQADRSHPRRSPRTARRRFFSPGAAGRAAQRRRSSGFQEFGLPYAPDPAVTRYLAAFLTAHRNVAMDDVELPAGQDPARPDIVLFNGGLFESPVLRQRMIDSLRADVRRRLVADRAGQRAARPGRRPRRGLLRHGPPRPRRADRRRPGEDVLHRRGQGAGSREQGAEERNRSGKRGPMAAHRSLLPAPCSTALCLVPAGVEPGQDVNLSERRFDLLVSEPVEFPLYVSSTRLTDRPGELVPVDREQMTPLPPIRTVMRARKKGEAETVGVNLHARLTEIGTLDLWCSEVEGKRSWRLQFDVRSATQTDMAAHESAAESEGFVDEATWQECRAAIEQVFGEGGTEKPEGLMKRLGGRDRHEPQRLAHVALPPLVGSPHGRRSRTAEERRSTKPAGSICSASACGPATAWRSMIGAWRRRGDWCRASSSILRPPCGWKAGSSGGGSAAACLPGSSRPSPNRSWGLSAACTG